MIIDVHAHPPEKHPFRFFDSEAPMLSSKESAAIALEQMEMANVNRAGLLGCRVAPGQTMEEIQAVNDFTAKIVRAHPDRFFGMVFINPALPPKVVVDELDRCLAHPEFRAVKLELDLNCRDTRLDAVAACAIAYNVPVLHHAWYLNLWNLGEVDRRDQRHRSEPRDVAHWARRFPELRIIMAHLEGSGVRGLIDIADCPNVWVDTSGSLPFSGTLEYGVKLLGSERILFGSDLPYRGYETQLGRILGSQLNDADRSNILHRNAAALFSF